MPRLNLDTVFNFGNGKLRPTRENLMHQTLKVRREMLHDDKSCINRRRHFHEEFFESFDTSGRGTDADDN